MTFGSWAYHGIEIDLGFYDGLERMDISDLEKESTEWEIISKTESKKVHVFLIICWFVLRKINCKKLHA